MDLLQGGIWARLGGTLVSPKQATATALLVLAQTPTADVPALVVVPAVVAAARIPTAGIAAGAETNLARSGS